MDLNMMMREQAVTGLQRELDAAVTNGDTEAARKVTEKIAALAAAAVPKAPPFTGQDVYAVLETKAPWYGVDPKKSAKAEELGKSMKLSKFASAEAFADALIKAVDEEFKPAPAAGEGEGDTDGDDDTGEGEDEKPAPKVKRTDAPGEGDNNQRTIRRATSGPWTKLADAPADIQKEIKRSAEKFVSARATKEQRESFIVKALESQYQMHQRKAGKK